MDKEMNQAGSLLPACTVCGRPLIPDEIAMTRKMINRGARQFLCLTCLSRRFDVPEDVLREKIEEFREMGCTLFL
ncbi:MAG: hypothetical protein K6E17_06115 [Clostridiales bacterium]|nr:hypothetical protein [Clostridiales bacterium]